MLNYNIIKSHQVYFDKDVNSFLFKNSWRSNDILMLVAEKCKFAKIFTVYGKLKQVNMTWLS